MSFAGFMISCSSAKNINKDYLYFTAGSDTVAVPTKETTIQSNDLLSIQVFSRTLNQEQAAIFNLPSNNNNVTLGYQVSSAGTIEMPVIGNVKVAGFTKDQLQILLMKRLTDYVKNPSVLIRYLQFNINVLGEVRTPGTLKFAVDRVTIIDAISGAGDLTDFGRREDVMVIREENGQKVYHYIDLRKKNIYESPVYLLQPNDVVYVQANKNKLRELGINPEVQRKTGFIFSVISITTTLATLILTLTR